jgi:type I restriction enzyme, S subunit
MTAAWGEARVGDILQLEYGKPLEPRHRKSTGIYPVFGANGEKDRSDKYYFAKPSIIVGRKGSAGELQVTKGPFWPLDVTFFVTFDNCEYDLRFLYYLLANLDLPSLAKGVKPGINRQEVYSQAVRVPTLREQRRIARLLDVAFEGIASASANAEKTFQGARDLFDVYREQILESRSRGWPMQKLADVSDVQSGGTPSVSQKRFWGGDIAWYSSGELGEVLTAEPKRYISGAGLAASNAKVFPTGSLLIGMYDTAALKMSILDRPAAFNQAVAGVKPNRSIDLEYALHVIAANKPRLLLERRGVRQKNLSLAKIKGIFIPVPDISEQRATLRALQSAKAQTTHLESIYRRKLAALAELKQSLLHHAFTGQF